MGKTVLVTGGAGFVGLHLADELLRAGYAVRVLDCLAEHVHGGACRRPERLPDDVDLRVGDVRDADHVVEALVGVDLVVHLAATDAPGHATSVNGLGTAVLLDALGRRPVERLVVASSVAVYGEGRYVADDGTVHDEVERPRARLDAGMWDPVGADGARLWPVPTPEDKRPRPASAYARTRWHQEQACLAVGRVRRISTVVLRLFPTVGARMTPSSPYTGMFTEAAARLLDGLPPLVPEDGGQLRDFVAVADVARAFRLALEHREVDGVALNVGGGVAETLNGAMLALARALGCEEEPRFTRRHRHGEIRHCFADVSAAERLLGFRAEVPLEQALAGLLPDVDERIGSRVTFPAHPFLPEPALRAAPGVEAP